MRTGRTLLNKRQTCSCGEPMDWTATQCVSCYNASRRATPERDRARFDASYVVEANGCWMWKRRSPGSPYGRFHLGVRQVNAHTAAWTLLRGPIPEGSEVCHSCDVMGCVNPDHLWLGTHADNMADMARKGRGGKAGKKGAAHLNARLTEASVLEARRLWAEGLSLRAIGERLGGATPSMLSAAIRGRTWSHVVTP